MEEKYSYECSPYGSNPRPHRVGSSNRKSLCGFRQEHSAQDIEDNKTGHPLQKGQSLQAFGFSEAESEGHFAQSCENKNNPTHMTSRAY